MSIYSGVCVYINMSERKKKYLYRNNRFIRIYKKQQRKRIVSVVRIASLASVLQLFSAKTFSELYHPLPVIKWPTSLLFVYFISVAFYLLANPKLTNIYICIFAYKYLCVCMYCVYFNQCGISYAAFLHIMFCFCFAVHTYFSYFVPLLGFFPTD